MQASSTTLEQFGQAQVELFFAPITVFWLGVALCVEGFVEVQKIFSEPSKASRSIDHIEATAGGQHEVLYVRFR